MGGVDLYTQGQFVLPCNLFTALRTSSRIHSWWDLSGLNSPLLSYSEVAKVSKRPPPTRSNETRPTFLWVSTEAMELRGGRLFNSCAGSSVCVASVPGGCCV